jgi:hypothetical protein
MPTEWPPTISTSPFGSKVAVCPTRAVFKLPVSVHVPEVAATPGPTAKTVKDRRTSADTNIMLRIIFFIDMILSVRVLVLPF